MIDVHNSKTNFGSGRKNISLGLKAVEDETSQILIKVHIQCY